MAGEGYGTTSIGTGLAQVIDNAKPYTAQIGKAYADKAAADEKKRLAAAKETRGLLKDLPKGASLTYSPYLNKTKQDIYNFALENINNPNKQSELIQMINDFGADLAMAQANDKLLTQRMAKVAEGGQYHNIENLDRYNTPRDFSTIKTKEDAFKMFADDNRLLNDVVKNTYDYKDHSAYVGSQIDQYAQLNQKDMGNNEWGYEVTQPVLESVLKASFEGNVDNFRHYIGEYKKDPELSVKYKDDDYNGALAAAVKDYSATQLGKHVLRPTKGLTIVNNNNMGGDNKSFDDYAVTEQVFKEGFGVGGEKRDVKQLVAMYATPVVHGTFKVPVGGTINGKPSDGTKVVKDVKFNLTKQKATMDEDITYTGTSGAKITIKKGEVINEDDIPLATRVLGRPPKFTYKYVSEGFTPTGEIVNVDAEFVAPASVAFLRGQSGKGAMGVYQKKSNKELQEKGKKNKAGKIDLSNDW